MSVNEKNPRDLFKERYERVMTTISIKEPDRVPIAPATMFYPTEQMGMSKKEAMYDFEKTARAFIKILALLNWDLLPPLLGLWPGRLFDILGVTFFKWPGAVNEEQRLAHHLTFQFVEVEYMKAEEYEDFFADPTGFSLRKLLPRQSANLQGYSEFPEASDLASGLGVLFGLAVFNTMPTTKKMKENLQEASEYFFNFLSILNKYEKDAKKMGFPLEVTGVCLAPFDVVSDLLRGMRGSMLDMYRRPEDLKRLVEIFFDNQIKGAIQLVQLSPKNKIIFMPLHRGADGFMSNEQFEEFYWPGLTSVMVGLIKYDLIPGLFLEGGYNERLEYLAEFAKKHKGKVLYWFDKTDIIRAKEILGDHACIRGNVPASLLITGTSHQVEEYVKKCIEGCSEGGGYIVDGGVAGIPDDAKPENVKAMTDAVFKYGLYCK